MNIKTFIFGCLIAAFVSFQASGKDPVAEAAALLYNKKTTQKGILALQELAASKDPKTSMRAILVVGPVLREKAPKKLIEILKPYSLQSDKNFSYPRIEAYTEHARLTAHRESLEQAIHALDKSYEQGKPGLSRVISREAMGDCIGIRSDHAKAVAFYQSALKEGAKHFHRKRISKDGSLHGGGELEPAKPNHKDWLAVRGRISRKLRDAQIAARTDKLGEDFVLYELARQHHAAKRYKEAIGAYDETIKRFSKSVYGEASRFYRCLCLKGVKDRQKALSRFIEDKPMGLYRGEAMYELGQIALTETWDVKDAMKSFEATIEWCKRVRKGERAIKLFSIPEKSRSAAAPPSRFQNIDNFGGVYQEKIPAAAVVNRQTAKWYLNRLERDARFGLVFAMFTQDKWDDAKKVLDPVLDLDPELRRLQENGNPNTYLRYASCCKIRRILRESYLFQGVDANTRLRLHHVEFLYLQRQFAQAEERARAVLREVEGRKDKRAMPMTLLTLAFAVQQNFPHDAPWKAAEKKYKQRDKILKRIIDEFPKSKAAAHAHWYYARTIKRRGYDIPKEFVVHLRKAMELGKGRDVEEEALGTLVMVYVATGREKEITQDIARFVKLDPENKKLVDELRENYRRREQRKRKLEGSSK